MWEIDIVHILHKNVKWHASSVWCFLLCPHKLFLLLYTFPHVSHLYIFTPLQIVLWQLLFFSKWNTVSHISQHHSWKHVTCDENYENKNVYKIMILIIIIIIMIIIIIIIPKPSNKQLCQKHWYTKDVSNLCWYIWWFRNITLTLVEAWYSLEQYIGLKEDKLSSTTVDFIRSEGNLETKCLYWFSKPKMC